VKQFFSRQWHLIAFAVGLVLFFWLLWSFIEVVLPFLVGFLLAYLLLPLVKRLERVLPPRGRKPGLRRMLATGIVYLVALIIIGLWGFYMVTVVGSSLMNLFQNAPQVTADALQALQNWFDELRRQLPDNLQQQINSVVGNLGAWFGNALRDALLGGVSFITNSTSFLFGFLSLPFFVFFLLKDWERLRDGFYRGLEPWMREHARNVAGIIDRVVGSYVRGLIFMSIIITVLVFTMLSVLQIQFAPALAVFSGLMEFIPILGPWLGGGAGVAVALATAPDKVVWVVVGYLIIQQIENNVMVPRIMGGVMQMPPALIIVVGVLGAYLAGLWGFIIAIPATVMIAEILRYIRRTARENEVE